MATDKIDIERTIVRLKNEISDIALQIGAARQEMSELNAQVKRKGHLRQGVYDKIVKRQLELKSFIFDCERQMADRKSRVRTMSVEKQALPDASELQGGDSIVVSELRFVRDKYLTFSKDETRLPHLRDQASSFVGDLNTIISSHVQRRERP
jgi:hypothetical protein